MRCLGGAVYDVIIDLRKDSPTYTRRFGIELSAAIRHMLYVPERFAHGFITLADDSEMLYFISTCHVPEAARGARWNHPVFGIAWPEPVQNISAKDRELEDFLS